MEMEELAIQSCCACRIMAGAPILNAPGVWIGGGFGQLTSSQGARNIQFALKLYY